MRLLTPQAVMAIMSKRAAINESHVGKRVKFQIQGNGTVIDVKNAAGELVRRAGSEDEVLQKKIFNGRANSSIAINNQRNKDILIAGLKAHKAGDLEGAHKLFNEYLNKVQFSFGILLPSAKADKISDGVEVAGVIVKKTTENGSLLTIDDASTITVVEPEVLNATTFDMADFEASLQAEEDAEAEKLTAAQALKSQKAAAKAAK